MNKKSGNIFSRAGTIRNNRSARTISRVNFGKEIEAGFSELAVKDVKRSSIKWKCPRGEKMFDSITNSFVIGDSVVRISSIIEIKSSII